MQPLATQPLSKVPGKLLLRMLCVFGLTGVQSDFEILLPTSLFSDVKGRLPFRPISVDPFIVYETYVAKSYDKMYAPKTGNVVIDVGAYIGDYVLKASHMVGSSGTVVAFEPHPKLADLCRKTIQINGLRNVEFFEEYVWSQCSNKSFGEFNVTTQTLDARTDDLVGIDLLKIDVDGPVAAILEGAEETLRRTSAVIVELDVIGEKYEIVATLTKSGFGCQFRGNMLIGKRNRGRRCRRFGCEGRRYPEDACVEVVGSLVCHA